MSLIAGSRLGPYQILSALGAGAMGEVYRARDTRLDRDVAIKILPERFAADGERVARFQREAKVLASLNHPSIAAIYGLESAAGVTALVMELVEGEDLAQRLARGAIPLDEALPIAKQIAEALEAAHEQGIIHRDLKPANIKLRPDGTVKILDFGLAKALEPVSVPDGDGTASPTITNWAVTQMGVILGTAAYMSPEQARGRQADRRSDVWAFGAVLYEMLTGARAFPGEDIAETIAAVMKGTPDWSALPADVPAHIVGLIQRCLEKDRKKRIAHISTALFLLDEPAIVAPAGVAPVSVPARPIWKRAIPSVVTALLVGALAGGVAWYLRPSSTPPTVTRFALTLTESTRFTHIGRAVIAISPDGTQIVYAADFALHLRPMSDLKEMLIPGTDIPEGVLNPVFSPDGQSIAFWSAADRTIKRIAISGGAAATICPADRPFGMTWDADGILFGEGSAGVMRVSASGGTLETLVKVNAGELAHGPQMLPDGRTVLFTLATDATNRWDKAKIVVQSLRSGERRTLIEPGSDGRYLPTGHIVYALGGRLLAVPFNLRRMEVTGGSVPIVEGVRRADNPDFNTGVAHFSVSETGSLIFVPGPVSRAADQRNLVRVDRQGGTEQLKLPPGPYEFPRVSPDGKRLAFGTDDGKEAIVWVYDLSGASAMRRLTFEGRNRFPIWSADGEKVAFQSDREGDLGIFWQRADGTARAERLTSAEQGASHFPEAWAPNNETFLFSASEASGVSLWTFSVHDRKAVQFGDVRPAGPNLPRAVFSPDGRWVAYGTAEARIGPVYVQPFPATGAKYQISRAAAHSPRWSPDGREIYYVETSSRPAGQLVVETLTTQAPFSAGNPVALPGPRLQLSGVQLVPRQFDIGPDGRIIGIVDAAQTPAGVPAPLRIDVVLNWFEELKARVPTK